MPRHAKGARLYLYRRKGRKPVWVIRDGESEISTGCALGDRGEAEKALSAHIEEKHRPQILGRDTDVADILIIYSAVNPADPVPYHLKALAPFWSGKTLGDVNGDNCRSYVVQRTTTGRKVAEATARREMETLAAAINHCNREKGTPVAQVTLPAKSPRRERWLTRKEAARLLAAALGIVPVLYSVATRQPIKWGRLFQPQRHVARFILIGLYTATRHEAILKLQWNPNTTGGWLDLEHDILYRRGIRQEETRKRRPPSKIARRLVPHLRRWREMDAGRGFVIHYGKDVVFERGEHIKVGRGIAKERRGFERARSLAGLGDDVTPHVLRHTSATWLMQRRISIWDASGFSGMSEKTLIEVYGHHHPDFQSEAANAF